MLHFCESGGESLLNVEVENAETAWWCVGVETVFERKEVGRTDAPRILSIHLPY
jgi:hypothetical protein